MAWLSRTVDWLDQINPAWLLLPNSLIALWVLFAHGGALLLVHLGKVRASDFGDQLEYAYFTIIPAAAVLLLAIFAWARPANRGWVLKTHALVLLCLAAFVLYFALDVVANGIPRTNRFSWDMGLFIFALAYPVYLARRTLIPSALISNPWLRYAHIIAVLAAIGVSMLVFWRIDAAAA